VDLIVFEKDRLFIIRPLRSGDLDYAEAANEAV